MQYNIYISILNKRQPYLTDNIPKFIQAYEPICWSEEFSHKSDIHLNDNLLQ